MHKEHNMENIKFTVKVTKLKARELYYATKCGIALHESGTMSLTQEQINAAKQDIKKLSRIYRMFHKVTQEDVTYLEVFTQNIVQNLMKSVKG